MDDPAGLSQSRVDAETPAERRWRRLVDVAGMAAGVAAYVYVAGGAVVYFAFLGADLPAGAVVAELPARRFLVSGLVLTTVGVPAVVALSYLMRAALDRAARFLDRVEEWGRSDAPAPNIKWLHPTSHGPPAPAGDAPRDAGAVSGLAGIAFDEVKGAAQLAKGLATAAAAFISVLILVPRIGASPTSLEEISALAVAAALIWGFVCQVIPFLRHLDPRAGALLRYTTLFAAFVTLAGACFLAYRVELRLPRATLISLSGGCITGTYLSHDAQGVHLVDGRTRSVAVFPSAKISSASIAGSSAVEDRGIVSIECPKPLGDLWDSIAPPPSPVPAENDSP